MLRMSRFARWASSTRSLGADIGVWSRSLAEQLIRFADELLHQFWGPFGALAPIELGLGLV